MDLNKVMLIGNIVAEPEIKAIPSGTNVATLRVATNRKWKDQSTGDFKEEAQFHSIVAWGKLAEICSQYMSKGMKIYVEGRLTTRSWDDKQTGQKRYMTEIVAENVIMLGGGKGQGNYQSNSSNSNSNNYSNQTSGSNSNKTNSTPNIPNAEEIPTINIDDSQDEINLSDIPF